MAGNSGDSEYVCCFCGQPLSGEDAVQLTASTKALGEEQQSLFAHKKCLARVVHSSVPLHPDLSDQ
jgi:hypothetical protein